MQQEKLVKDNINLKSEADKKVKDMLQTGTTTVLAEDEMQQTQGQAITERRANEKTKRQAPANKQTRDVQDTLGNVLIC